VPLRRHQRLIDQEKLETMIRALVESVQQREAGGSYADLVSDFDYGPTEQVTEKTFGNGVVSTYTYDANALYRLINIYTATSSMEEMGFGGGLLLAQSPALHPLAIAMLEDQGGQFEHVQEILDDVLTSAHADRKGSEEPEPQMVEEPKLDTATSTASTSEQVDPEASASSAESATSTPETSRPKMRPSLLHRAIPISQHPHQSPLLPHPKAQNPP
jgi:hypothetical protein